MHWDVKLFHRYLGGDKLFEYIKKCIYTLPICEYRIHSSMRHPITMRSYYSEKQKSLRLFLNYCIEIIFVFMFW